jgi:hypothetical protein
VAVAFYTEIYVAQNEAQNCDSNAACCFHTIQLYFPGITKLKA